MYKKIAFYLIFFTENLKLPMKYKTSKFFLKFHIHFLYFSLNDKITLSEIYYLL